MFSELKKKQQRQWLFNRTKYQFKTIIVGLIGMVLAIKGAAAQLRIDAESVAGFQTDFIIENIGDDPVKIYSIIVNKNEMCIYQIWVKMDRISCPSAMPGTGGFVNVGPMKGLHFMVPKKTQSLSETRINELMNSCGWRKKEFIELGIGANDSRFKFSLYLDNDNGQRCFNHRSITLETSDGEQTFRGGLNPRR